MTLQKSVGVVPAAFGSGRPEVRVPFRNKRDAHLAKPLLQLQWLCLDLLHPITSLLVTAAADQHRSA